MSTADCISIFDWERHIDLSAWLDFVLECFQKTPFQPDIVSFGADASHSRDSSLDELGNAVRGRQQDCRVIELLATRPGYKQLAFGWRMCAGVNMTEFRTAILCWETGRLDCSEVAKQMATLFGPVYGIGFQRPFLKGPDLYAYGMSAGLGYTGADRIEANRIRAWMRERMEQNLHKRGMFRDVYPLNLLTPAHITQEVERHSFAEWVRQSGERGELFDLGNQQWVWQVPDVAIQNVRGSLRSAGLIIAE
jgi:hypothetical protein